MPKGSKTSRSSYGSCSHASSACSICKRSSKRKKREEPKPEVRKEKKRRLRRGIKDKSKTLPQDILRGVCAHLAKTSPLHVLLLAMTNRLCYDCFWRVPDSKNFVLRECPIAKL